MSDKIRVLRIVEYIGGRDAVESNIVRSIHGEKQLNGLIIRATTLGNFPEIIETGVDMDMDSLRKKTTTELSYLKEIVEEALDEKK